MTARRLGVGIAAGLVMLGSGPAIAAGDPARGAKLFNKCKVCHPVDAPERSPYGLPYGPYLVGIIGRPAGSVEGYMSYSQNMKNSGIVWDETSLDQFLADPRAMVPHTNMPFPALKKAEDRANVIAYLKSLGK